MDYREKKSKKKNKNKKNYLIKYVKLNDRRLGENRLDRKNERTFLIYLSAQNQDLTTLSSKL
ncbi:hypothetical protein BpHYR1_011823 [Brachionus plicatilis]|uniref:Uncharacterized protein n=1 Tax=Brachionus plicatilis TaxID=10195 RepID=A0A3M7RWM8_BRAPC|nr:hypothetical protein BpHYR1_011823 [Brachionus plicatilis]